jgi:hypothetical protein
MAIPTSSGRGSWKRWIRLALETIIAAAIISAPVWGDGLTTIPPR